MKHIFDLFTTKENLFDKLCTGQLLREAFHQVSKNRGAPGIDKITIKQFKENLEGEISILTKELINWTYNPKPVRRVEIPKFDGGIRKLGIPCIKDRVVQVGIKILLEPILEPTFSNSSYGFRPGRNQRQAIEKARDIVKSGKPYGVDIDLSKFFDRIHHDKLISKLRKHGIDRRILRLIGMTLRSGIMQNGIISKTTEGTTQGSPLSPLLSNVVLDELDKLLEEREIPFCRFADDCLIFVRTRKSAARVMKSTTKYLESKMKLVVNKEKSKIDLIKHLRFLGMTIVIATIAISTISMNRAMAKVKELTPRGTSFAMERSIYKINSWYMGWSGYYRMTNYPRQLNKIEAHIRRRLRARIVDQQKSRRNLFNKLLKRGVFRRSAAGAAYSNNKRWAVSHFKGVERAYPNKWFKEEMGLKTRSNEQHKHWFALRKWIRLT